MVEETPSTSTAEERKFSLPNLLQVNTDAIAPWMLVGMVLSPVAGAVSKYSVWGNLFLLPLVWVFGTMIEVSMVNAVRRSRWARTFARRVSPAEVAALVAPEPGRWVLHAYFYRQISRINIPPVCVIEDTRTKEGIAVHPASWKAVFECRKLGVTEVKNFANLWHRAPAKRTEA